MHLIHSAYFTTILKLFELNHQTHPLKQLVKIKIKIKFYTPLLYMSIQGTETTFSNIILDSDCLNPTQFYSIPLNSSL